MMRNPLGAVDKDQRACFVGEAAEQSHIVDRSQRVGQMRDGNDAHAARRQQPTVGINVQLAGIIDRDHTQRGAGPLRQHLPRDDVGMMLHYRDHNLITGVEIAAAPARRDEVDALSGAAREEDLPIVLHVEKARNGLTGRFVLLGRR